MRLGRYRLLTQIGAGSDGVSYRAQSEAETGFLEVHELGLARQNPERWAWLVSRLRIAVTYTHSAVIRVLELALEDDPPYVVRQCAGESTLANLICERGALSEAEVLPLVHLLAGAVTASHSLGLVHGRIDPSQVWLDGCGRPKLDFTGTEVHSTRRDALILALDSSCQAPEVLGGSTPSRAADVYSLGALLACLLSGIPRPEVTHTAGGWPVIEASSALGALIRELTVADPDDRPLAHQVVRRLAGLMVSTEATGEWKPTDSKAGLAGSSLDVGTTTLPHQPIPLAEPRRETLGRFRLLELLGEGGQGAVYRAQDMGDGSIVALKILRTDRAGVPRPSNDSAKRPGFWPSPTTRTSSIFWNTTTRTASPTSCSSSLPARTSMTSSASGRASTNRRLSRSWPTWPAHWRAHTIAESFTATSSRRTSCCLTHKRFQAT